MQVPGRSLRHKGKEKMKQNQVTRLHLNGNTMRLLQHFLPRVSRLCFQLQTHTVRIRTAPVGRTLQHTQTQPCHRRDTTHQIWLAMASSNLVLSTHSLSG